VIVNTQFQTFTTTITISTDIYLKLLHKAFISQQLCWTLQLLYLRLNRMYLYKTIRILKHLAKHLPSIHL